MCLKHTINTAKATWKEGNIDVICEQIKTVMLNGCDCQIRQYFINAYLSSSKLTYNMVRKHGKLNFSIDKDEKNFDKFKATLKDIEQAWKGRNTFEFTRCSDPEQPMSNIVIKDDIIIIEC